MIIPPVEIPMSLAKRRDMGRRAILAYPGWSDRRLAAYSRLSRHLIEKLRRQMIEAGEIADDIRREGRDGKKYGKRPGLPRIAKMTDKEKANIAVELLAEMVGSGHAMYENGDDRWKCHYCGQNPCNPDCSYVLAEKFLEQLEKESS